MFLFPLAITLILLSLFGPLFKYDRRVFISVTAFTLVAAIFDLLKALPYGLHKVKAISTLINVGSWLPFSDLGLGWVCPAAVGLVIGVILHFAMPARKAA